ncbi:arsenate reductase ArsC [Vibrio navarrensis]|uniref:arsenate reductase ArsC n=1 Tax=Vibrio navarrensis TaxID=29495 RepID=UPI001D0560CC|nr:arsenate reductase ArsC [Vibrio navarrensis]
MNKEAVASSIWLLFFLLECDSKLTHYHPNWLNFNSDNYPARGGYLDMHGFDASEFQSTSWEERLSFHPDLIITVCDTMHNETCPNWLSAGIRVAWDLEPLPNDEASVSEFNKQCDKVYSSLKRRIEVLANIDFQNLDSEEIKQHALDLKSM